MGRPILWFDFETGGLDPEVHSPLSFAMIGVDGDGKVLGEWYTQLRFEPMVVTAGALAVNKIDIREPGLSLKDFQNGYWSRINEWFYGGSTTGSEGKMYPNIRPNRNNMPLMGGHNVSFDQRFLQKQIGEWTALLSYQMDTLTMSLLARELGYFESANLQLGTVAQALGIHPTGELHNALVDLKMTIMVYQRLKEMMKNGQRSV
jgi:oligoribonuclease (3'-5' exoribonuclease)